jgi:hypothetical protein
MVTITRRRAAAAGLANVQPHARDVVAAGFGRPPAAADAVLLFNILHAERPGALLEAARAAVKPSGVVAVIHWRRDVATPRGPALDIRPGPEQIVSWAETAGLRAIQPPFLLPPWHFGVGLTPTQA